MQLNNSTFCTYFVAYQSFQPLRADYQDLDCRASPLEAPPFSLCRGPRANYACAVRLTTLQRTAVTLATRVKIWPPKGGVVHFASIQAAGTVERSTRSPTTRARGTSATCTDWHPSDYLCQSNSLIVRLKVRGINKNKPLGRVPGHSCYGWLGPLIRPGVAEIII